MLNERKTGAHLTFKVSTNIGNIFCDLPSGPEPSHHFSSLTSYSQTWRRWCDGLGLVCCFKTWPVCHNWWNHECCFHYQILKENVWHEYPDSFPNPARKSITHWLKKKKGKYGFRGGLGLNPPEKLWHNPDSSLMDKNPKVWLNNTILQRRVGHNSSTAMQINSPSLITNASWQLLLQWVVAQPASFRGQLFFTSSFNIYSILKCVHWQKD